MLSSNKINEQKAALGFSRQAIHFDELYKKNSIIQFKRQRVREHVSLHLPLKASILELNAGTGDDAIWFARQGHQVHATDLAAGMLDVLTQKVTAAGLQDQISTELRSFTELQELDCKGPFDYIFSNSAGLNCTGELDQVLSSISNLLKPGGIVTLVILPKFCLWETLLLFKGKFKTATRRFFSANGKPARVEGEYFKCWYYNPSYVRRKLRNGFELLSIEGLCSFVPPSYMDGFPEKHSFVFKSLLKLEERFKSKWPWRSIGDYYIISLKKICE